MLSSISLSYIPEDTMGDWWLLPHCRHHGQKCQSLQKQLSQHPREKLRNDFIFTQNVDVENILQARDIAFLPAFRGFLDMSLLLSMKNLLSFQISIIHSWIGTPSSVGFFPLYNCEALEEISSSSITLSPVGPVERRSHTILVQ